MSKKLNIIEAMKMPLGSQFNIVIEETENTPGFLITNIVLEGNINEKRRAFLNSATDEYLNLFSDYLDATFIPIQQPVSFMEAIEEGSKDKKIKVVMDRITFPKHFADALNQYMTLNEIFEYMPKHLSRVGIRNVIKEGKWYIEESEADSND